MMTILSRVIACGPQSLSVQHQSLPPSLDITERTDNRWEFKSGLSSIQLLSASQESFQEAKLEDLNFIEG